MNFIQQTIRRYSFPPSPLPQATIYYRPCKQPRLNQPPKVTQTQKNKTSKQGKKNKKHPYTHTYKYTYTHSPFHTHTAEVLVMSLSLSLSAVLFWVYFAVRIILVCSVFFAAPAARGGKLSTATLPPFFPAPKLSMAFICRWGSRGMVLGAACFLFTSSLIRYP